MTSDEYQRDLGGAFYLGLFLPWYLKEEILLESRKSLQLCFAHITKGMRKYSQLPMPGLKLKKKKNMPAWKEKVATAQSTLANE